MGNGLKTKLATLAVAVGVMRQASMFEKAAHADGCLVLTLELLGALVDRVETLERKSAAIVEDVLQLERKQS
jgi:predicted deacylase